MPSPTERERWDRRVSRRKERVKQWRMREKVNDSAEKEDTVQSQWLKQLWDHGNCLRHGNFELLRIIVLGQEANGIVSGCIFDHFQFEPCFCLN